MTKLNARKIILREKSDPVDGDARYVMTLHGDGQLMIIDVTEERRLPGDLDYRPPSGQFFLSFPASKLDEVIAGLREVNKPLQPTVHSSSPVS